MIVVQIDRFTWLAKNGVRTFVPKWRSRRDSNPRYGVTVYTLSRRAPSTTRPLLRSLDRLPHAQGRSDRAIKNARL